MKIFLSRPAFANLAAFWLAGSVAACSPDDRAPTTAFAGPGGMALAGSKFDRVYIANTGTDTLQVMRLTQDMRKIDLQPSPAQYFPLNIPAGPSPSQIAASRDGRFVFALDEITSTLRLFDADSARVVRNGQGEPMTQAVGPSDAQASSIVGSPWPCTPSETTATSICLARAYIGLRKLGAVAAVDVRQDTTTGALALVVDSTFAVGAAPSRMTAHPTKPVLFLTNAKTPEVVRLVLPAPGGLAQADASRVTLAAPGGALAVSGDGRLLAVARGAYQDVVFFTTAQQDVATGPLIALDANPIRTPLPTCVAACNQPATDACDASHAADAGLCSLPVGYASSSQPYTALYLGSIPTALVALDSNVTQAPLLERCAAGGSQASTAFAQAFAVASMDGTIQYMGIGTAQDGSPTVRIVDKSSCEAPTAKATPLSNAVPSQVLAPCAALPAGRARMACLADADSDADAPGVIGLMRGLGPSLPVGLVWEGILPGGDRAGGSGAIDELGRLYDLGTTTAGDLKDLPLVTQKADRSGTIIARGDVVQILTPQLATAQCGSQGTTAASLCALERRIVAVVVEKDRPTRLQLDRPLQADCFSPGAPIAYRIRAGDSFLAAPLDEGGAFIGHPVRLAPGDTYGAGLLAGATASMFFTIDPQLDIGASLSACERYLADKPAQGQPPWRSRAGAIAFNVQDPYAPVLAGRTVDPLRNTASNVGRLPYAMVMTRGPSAQGEQSTTPPVLIVSFSGSDSILIAAPPSTGAGAGSEPSERLLQ
jgi:hypothetical protein